MNVERFFTLVDSIPLLRVKQVRYVLAGGTATVVNFSTLYSLTEFFHVWYLLSSMCAVAFGFATSFVLQKFWTFRNMPLERVHVQLPQHIALSLLNIAVNTIVVYALVEYAGVWYLLAQFLSAAALAFVNYFVYRKYIFPDA